MQRRVAALAIASREDALLVRIVDGRDPERLSPPLTIRLEGEAASRFGGATVEPGTVLLLDGVSVRPHGAESIVVTTRAVVASVPPSRAAVALGEAGVFRLDGFDLGSRSHLVRTGSVVERVPAEEGLRTAENLGLPLTPAGMRFLRAVEGAQAEIEEAAAALAVDRRLGIDPAPARHGRTLSVGLAGHADLLHDVDIERARSQPDVAVVLVDREGAWCLVHRGPFMLHRVSSWGPCVVDCGFSEPPKEPGLYLFTGRNAWSYGDGRVDDIEEGVDGAYVPATEEAIAAVGIAMEEVRAAATDLEIELEPKPCLPGGR